MTRLPLALLGAALGVAAPPAAPPAAAYTGQLPKRSLHDLSDSLSVTMLE